MEARRANAEKDGLGLGLGLALSRQTMRDRGGDLWLANGPGERTFRLRLPLTVKAGNPRLPER